MPAKQTRRGRPRGSGLDDSGHLAAIAQLIEKDPGLKPTTAIKTLGISDPSTIRRLRDKYRKFSDGAEIKSPRLAHQPSRPLRSEKKVRRPENRVLPQVSQKSSRQPRTAPETPKAAQPASDPFGEPARLLCTVCSIGFQAAATTMEIQTAAMRQFFKVPPVAYAWRQQVAAINDLALFVYKSQSSLLVRPN